jgi:hypothetical protein
MVQVKLQLDYCEELGIHLSLSKLDLNLTSKRVVSYARGRGCGSINVRDVEKNMEDQEWREEQLATHHGYSAVIYLITVIFCLLISI